MRRAIVILIIVISIMSGCSSSKLSFSEIENVPNKVQEKIDPNLKLQSINEKKGSYIIFHSSGEVDANLDTQGDTVIIKFNVSDSKDNAVKQNVYYLTMDSNHDTIHVQVDGELVPFDEVIVTEN